MSSTTLDGLAGLELGSYRLEKPVAVTRLGGAYRAQDIAGGNPVFIVLVKTGTGESSDLGRRFRRRTTTVAQLAHAGIAPAIDMVETASEFSFAAVSHVKGASLAEILEELHAKGDRFDTVDALELVRSVAAALSVAHPAGIIHHHLTPSHIVVSEGNLPHLIDLAIPLSAAVAEREEFLRAPRLGYLSTEQMQRKALSGQSNIYSLGIILYELLAGERPEIPASSWDIFDQRRSDMPRGVPLEEARPELAADTHRVVRDCLWREEWNRFETVDELSQALDRAIKAEKQLANRGGIRFRPRRRHFALASLVVLLILLVFVLLRGRTGSLDESSSAPVDPAPIAMLAQPEALEAKQSLGATENRSPMRFVPTRGTRTSRRLKTLSRELTDSRARELL